MCIFRFYKLNGVVGSYRSSKPINVTGYKSWEAGRHLSCSRRNAGPRVEGLRCSPSFATFWVSDFTFQGLSLLSCEMGMVKVIIRGGYED